MSLKINTLALDQLTADPVSPVDGDIWFNVTTGMFRLRSGGVSADLVAGVFGAFYKPARDDAESQNTSTTPQQKLRLTTDTLDAGTYRITWQLQLRSSNSNRDVFADVELDDVDLLAPLESDRVSYDQFSGKTTRVLTAAAHTIDIDFYAGNGAARTAFIRNVHIELWRVA